MYRGVVRVFDTTAARPPPIGVLRSEDFPPVSPVERELGNAVASLREGMDKSIERSEEVQTAVPDDMWLGGMQSHPAGYEVPRVFVRALSEAVEQAITTYCPGLVDQREAGMFYLLNQVAEFIRSPHHLYFETFEPSPTWYDYMRITVFDTITASPIGTADLVPPTTNVIIPNVNVPLFESSMVTADSVPHLPQVELTFLKFSNNAQIKNPIVAQSVTVPLELFTKSTSVLCHVHEKDEREVSYRAVLVRKQTLTSADTVGFPPNSEKSS